ncbi:MAG: hypothetical protein M3Q88_07710 [Pseudomonadota bacterium]|nr:hypothetical protein [Pseudomonadota bacterium]
MNRALIFLSGVVATLAFAGLWHGPLGAGDRLAARAEKIARSTLDANELPAVSALLARRPLARVIILSGPADSFQRSELVRVMHDVPGINDVRWDPASLPHEPRR